MSTYYLDNFTHYVETNPEVTYETLTKVLENYKEKLEHSKRFELDSYTAIEAQADLADTIKAIEAKLLDFDMFGCRRASATNNETRDFPATASDLEGGIEDFSLYPNAKSLNDQTDVKSGAEATESGTSDQFMLSVDIPDADTPPVDMDELIKSGLVKSGKALLLR